VADFLEALRAKELEAIAKLDDVKHPGMIGDMYEGLTRHLLERAIFSGIDLRVVEGKIRDADGGLSDQLDCMIVVGDGVNLPHTTHFIYPTDQVLAVVEVKKTLYGAQLGDAYENLLTIADKGIPRAMSRRALNNAFRAITAIDLESDEHLAALSTTQQYVYHNLVGEMMLPVRVALGYKGFTSEYGLREGLLGYLRDVLDESDGGPVKGYGPSSFPNLIVAGPHALVKLNGMPYALRHQSDQWLVYGSIRDKATVVLLELLWSRLVRQFKIDPSVFGEDLELEQISPLLYASIATTTDGRHGWTYSAVDFTKKELASREPTVPWEPTHLDEDQFVTVQMLCKRGEIAVDEDEDLRAFLTSRGQALSEFIERSLSTGLVYLSHDRHLRLATDECVCLIDPQLGYLAADNADGRVERWLARRTNASDAVT
jgi:hypothetical protein